MKRDYYEVLGVAKSVNEEELKRAYRKAALQHHPDRNPGNKKAEEKFRECSEAYQVLSDPNKRRAYDQYGHSAFENGGFGAGSGFSASGFSEIFEDIFEDFFGGGSPRQRNRARRGQDLRYEMELSFEEAVFGVEKELSVLREEACSTCKGDGAKPGTKRNTCPTCHGSGQILASSGFFSIARTCSRCHGQGSMIEQPCVDCRGQGRISVKRPVKVKIPAGVDNESRLRIGGEGSGGDKGGPRGDLYVDIFVKPHSFFVRKGMDIACEVPITFAQAALGDEIEVPTLTSMTKLKITPGTQTGKVYKLKGKGIASVHGNGIGDQEVHVTVETPTHLNEEQKALLKKFAEIGGQKINPISESFFHKVKQFLNK